PKWLADGSFLWESERSGWRHLYHYKADGTLIAQVTKGDWEVRALDGEGLQRISEQAGTHGAKFNPSMTLFVDSWSDVNTPAQARLHRAEGTLVKVVDANPSSVLDEYDLPKPEFLQVKARDGFVLEAMMIKPASFDLSKKYPVYEHHYGGPHAPQVSNAWKGTTLQFLQLVAQQGVVVWICDNRGASGKGAVSAWTLYKHFGETELRDTEDGLSWLKSQPYIDGSHIMTYGWSYGGFMTSYALTHSKSFVAGIAGGTVADWRDYDSIYTERYMLMPQNNTEGYKKSSPRWAAKDLHGNLLLLHGAVDDNVHPQNTMQFVYELEKAQMPFEMRLYPKQQHGVRDPALVYDLQKTILAFVRANLLK
ncbi:MAG TPA: prolyl oligopeptidase family serine peptidase, partial [Thermoanaerobaculia bacterium]